MNTLFQLPIPVNYRTAAVPKFAPFGTEYTPSHTMKIVGGRRISIANSISAVPKPPIESSRKNQQVLLNKPLNYSTFSSKQDG